MFSGGSAEDVYVYLHINIRLKSFSRSEETQFISFPVDVSPPEEDNGPIIHKSENDSQSQIDLINK